ncbi:hypothetical protein [Ruegeria profundi]|uniref:hypothetical protein n=1 Tax=Ruegeria profundi TaxID=1685378 RepID=UPI003C797F58
MKRPDKEQEMVEQGHFHMLAFEIFMHSIKMVLRNLKQAIQITLIPALIGGLVIIAFSLLFGISFEDISTEPNGLPDAASPGAVTAFLFCVLASLFAIMVWIVVSWHRFVLLEEYPAGFLPAFRSDRMLAYIGRMVMLALLGVIVLIPTMLVIGFLTQASAAMGILAWLLVVVGLSVAFYRVSPIMPAAAIGEPLKLTDAWRATDGANGTIVALVVLLVLFQMGLQLLFAILLIIPVIGALVVVFASMLIVPLINVSILTTFYGVFIEKRALS